jgi:hypothetical protein
MPSLSGARELYLLDRAPSSSPVAVLVPDSTGIPSIVEPEPLLVRVSYLPSDFDATQIDMARNRLCSAECELFAPLICPEGPPYRSGVVFHHITFQSGVTWHDHNMTARHGAMTRRYGVTTPVSPVSWIQDERHGRLGYFLSGDSMESTLWRIFRSEVDALERKILTLAPIQLAPALPRADFSRVSDQALQRELSAMYEDFCSRVSQQAFRDVPTKGRNIVEGFVADKLRSQGRTATARLGMTCRPSSGCSTTPRLVQAADGRTLSTRLRTKYGSYMAEHTRRARLRPCRCDQSLHSVSFKT